MNSFEFANNQFPKGAQMQISTIYFVFLLYSYVDKSVTLAKEES